MKLTEVLLRLSLAILFGLVVGTEREHRHRPAGIKTHILVCVGAALVSLIQVQMIEETVRMISADPNLSNVLKSDMGRLGAQVISGIGFLGAGTILRDKGSVKGLTTAATLWLTACVGLAVGMGYYMISIVTIIITMTVLIIIHLFQNLLLKMRGVKHIEVILVNKQEAMEFIDHYCTIHNIMIQNVELSSADTHLDDKDVNCSLLSYMYIILIPRTIAINRLLTDWQMSQHIASAVLSDAADE